MPLVNTYKRRDDDDEDDVEESQTSTASSAAPKSLSNLPETSKKRQSSFAAEAAAKLLKLTENVGADKLHSIDIASQMLDRNKEQSTSAKSSSNSSGSRSLLDMLPTPKSASSVAKPPQTSADLPTEDPKKPEEPQSKQQKTVSSAPPVSTPTLLTVPKTLKTKSLSPDVKLDEAFLAEEEDESKQTTNTSKPVAVGPPIPAARAVGPMRPSYLRDLNEDEDAPPGLAPYQPTVAESSAPNTTLHYDPSFGFVDSNTNVVELDMNQVIRQTAMTAAPLPSRPNFSSATRNANISRAARGKNQITYLAAIAGETERFNQEKKMEQARNKNRSGL